LTRKSVIFPIDTHSVIFPIDTHRTGS
jgi:hypothetical protein